MDQATQIREEHFPLAVFLAREADVFNGSALLWRDTGRKVIVKWTGKVAIVTGASSGIGRSLVIKLLEHGARVALASRFTQGVDVFVGCFKPASTEYLICPTDITDRDQVDALVEKTIEKFGRIDLLINCAGIGMYGGISDSDLGAVRRVFETNLFGAVHAIQKVYPYMAKNKSGVIVNVSSTAGFRSWPGNGFYCATKHAVNAITESLLLEAKKDGIDVVLIMPGTTNTNFIRNSINVAGDLRANPPVDMSPDEVAGRIIRAIEKKAPRTVLTVKGNILYLLNRISPRCIDMLFARKG